MNELGPEDLGKISKKDEAMMQVGGQVENEEKPLTSQETRGRSFLEKAKDRLGKIDKDKAVQIMGTLAAGGMVLTGMAMQTFIASQYGHDLSGQAMLVSSGIGLEITGLIAAGSIKGSRTSR